MKTLTSIAVCTALLVAPGVVFAQVIFELNADQERTVYTTVTKERVKSPPPAGFSLSVGAVVPADVELYEVPATVEYAPVRKYRYTVYEDQVYLVDPSDRKVVRVIRK
jgi:hypothetical protein